MANGTKWPGDAHYPHEKLSNVMRALVYAPDPDAMLAWAIFETHVAFMHGVPAWAAEALAEVDRLTGDERISSEGEGRIANWIAQASEDERREAARSIVRLYDLAAQMNGRQMQAAGIDPTYQ